MTAEVEMPDSELWKEFRAVKKTERDARAVSTIEQLAALGVTAEEQSKNVYRIAVSRGVVMYYPGSGKWQYRGKVMYGNLQSLRGYLKNEFAL